MNAYQYEDNELRSGPGVGGKYASKPEDVNIDYHFTSKELAEYVDKCRDAWNEYRKIITDAQIEAAAKALYNLRIDSPPCESKDAKFFFVIDTSTAEHEVNWPGEMVSEHTSYEDARKGLARAVLQAAMEAIETHGTRDVPVLQTRG